MLTLDPKESFPTYCGPWSHPHTARAADLLVDPYGNDRKQRMAAIDFFGAASIAAIWESSRLDMIR
jgi:hypothetical protein